MSCYIKCAIECNVFYDTQLVLQPDLIHNAHYATCNNLNIVQCKKKNVLRIHITFIRHFVCFCYGESEIMLVIIIQKKLSCSLNIIPNTQQ